MTAVSRKKGRVTGHALHIGIAETGKLRALDGDHTEALRHYREALRLAHTTGAPEVFFRHYTQCVLESLENTGAHAEVIDFCENAIAHFEALAAPLDLHRRDQAAMLERYAINLIKSGRGEDARDPLEQAISFAGPEDLPVARTLLNWLRRGMQPDLRRIAQLQTKHGYFTVTAQRVEPARAIDLPDVAAGTGARVM